MKSLYSLVLISCLVSSLPLYVNAEIKEDIEEKMEQLKSEIVELNQKKEDMCQEFRGFDSENTEEINLSLECSGIRGELIGKAKAYKALEQRLIEIEDNEVDFEREVEMAEKQKQDEVEKENREEKRLYNLIGMIFVGLLLIGALFLGGFYIILKTMKK